MRPRGIGRGMVAAMVNEMTKIAATVSAPSIKAPPAPGGLTGQMQPNPPSPISPQKIIGKSLRSTNLQKTDYSSVNTKPPTPNVNLTAGQKAMAPPAVG